MKNKSIAIYITVIGLLLIIVAGWYVFAFQTQPEPDPVSPDIPFTPTTVPAFTVPPPTKTSQAAPAFVPFDGQRAYADVETQVAFGPRIPGADGHAKIQEWMREELESAGWQVEVQESEAMGHPIQNIVAKRGEESPQIILGAHYDTRMFADNDPDPANHSLPVPGANDGASGVAVLLELARVLPDDSVPVWLVFFDAEDNGLIEGWEWTLGSQEFVENNSIRPRAVIVVDMIGDADLNIYKESYSNPDLADGIWDTAGSLGYGNKFISEYKYFMQDDHRPFLFISEYKYSMQDDHRPFLQAGIPAVLIIDFDYPYWHTVQDTPDKVSAESLQAVGDTLQTWVMGQSSQP